MPSKPFELPPQVAKAFVRDMRAFFKEENAIKRDEIASRQLQALAHFQRPREKRLRLEDIQLTSSDFIALGGVRLGQQGTHLAKIVAPDEQLFTLPLDAARPKAREIIE